MSATTIDTTPGRAGFREALAFEWTKFRSARSTLWTLIAIGLLPPVFAVFVAATGSLQPDDTILGGSLTGSILVQVVAAVLGALVMTGEYTSGMIRTTLTALPRRLTVLGAKATIVAAVLFAVTLASCTLAFAIGSALLDHDAYASGDPWPALPGIALMLSVSGLLGLAVGTALRRSAGAIAALVGVMLLPSLLGPLVGDLQRWVGGASPISALEKLTQTSDATHETVGSLSGWASLGIVAAYTAVALAGSASLLRSRDA
jgi:ABC-2 type transport system permease protein